MNYQEKKVKAGQIWDSMTKEERANIYFKLVGHYDPDPICAVNFLNGNWDHVGGNTRKLVGLLIN